MDLSRIPSQNYFTDAERQCHCAICAKARERGEGGFNANGLELDFLHHLNYVREFLFCAPMPMSSGYRCPLHPSEARKADPELGDHPCGVGADICLSGPEALRLVECVGAYNHAHRERGLWPPFSGIGVRQHGAYNKRFVHLGGNAPADGRPRPHLWSYP